MSDLYTEEIVKKEKTMKDTVIRVLLIAGICSSCFVTDGSWVVIYYSDHCICSSGLFCFCRHWNWNMNTCM